MSSASCLSEFDVLPNISFIPSISSSCAFADIFDNLEALTGFPKLCKNISISSFSSNKPSVFWKSISIWASKLDISPNFKPLVSPKWGKLIIPTFSLSSSISVVFKAKYLSIIDDIGNNWFPGDKAWIAIILCISPDGVFNSTEKSLTIEVELLGENVNNWSNHVCSKFILLSLAK